MWFYLSFFTNEKGIAKGQQGLITGDFEVIGKFTALDVDPETIQYIHTKRTLWINSLLILKEFLR